MHLRLSQGCEQSLGTAQHAVTDKLDCAQQRLSHGPAGQELPAAQHLRISVQKAKDGR